MENLYFIFYFFIYIFLSSIPTTKKCQIAYFEKKLPGINFHTLQIYKSFAGINFRRRPISKHFAEETFTNRAKNRENTKVSSSESFFLQSSIPYKILNFSKKDFSKQLSFLISLFHQVSLHHYSKE